MRSDDSRLLALQDEYKNGRGSALVEMYTLMKEVALKTINGMVHVYPAVKEIPEAERAQKAHDAATYIIEQFLKRPDFTIKRSVTGYLYLRIRWEVFGRDHQKKSDAMLVFVDTVPEEKEPKERHSYMVTDLKTGEKEIYGTSGEMYLQKKFKGLRKKRLVESIRTGRRWKHYTFDLITY